MLTLNLINFSSIINEYNIDIKSPVWTKSRTERLSAKKKKLQIMLITKSRLNHSKIHSMQVMNLKLTQLNYQKY